MVKKNVLIFPCGAVAAVEINFALRHSNLFKVYGASSVEDHGQFVFQEYIGGLPNIAEPSFISALNDAILENNIVFIIPTHDTVALFLQEHRREINAVIVCSPYETALLCRYKSKTYEKLKSCGFVPRLYDTKELQDIDFPVFLKKDDDQGARHTFIAEDKEQLADYLKWHDDMLICDYLPGEEMTVDCFTDRKRRLLFCNPRLSLKKWAGISARCTVAPLDDEIKFIADTINSRITFRGFWFFQIKRDRNGRFKLLEISTRFSGSFGLSRSLDVNLPVMALCDFCDITVSANPNTYDVIVDKSLIGRYQIDIRYERVYLDLDDTLVFDRKQVNAMMMMYVYQLLNRGKEIVLISKHDYDIEETLKNLKIDRGLFSAVIKVPRDIPKYRFMDNAKPSIFIDNCFAERKDAREYLGIPCFDVSNVDCLLDWRG